MPRVNSSDIPAGDSAPAQLTTARLGTLRLRHTWLVRVTHWITTACFLALLVSGTEIVISHPRFYWGETGNVMTPSLFNLPIPASDSSVNTGYGFVLGLRPPKEIRINHFYVELFWRILRAW